ncbi:MAG: hypothetical protein J5798_08080 [Spirochaetaceae bacterium]|nr:hypothetical protein [Spirochaetaceae bacterium]
MSYIIESNKSKQEIIQRLTENTQLKGVVIKSPPNGSKFFYGSIGNDSFELYKNQYKGYFFRNNPFLLKVQGEIINDNSCTRVKIRHKYEFSIAKIIFSIIWLCVGFYIFISTVRPEPLLMISAYCILIVLPDIILKRIIKKKISEIVK